MGFLNILGASFSCGSNYYYLKYRCCGQMSLFVFLKSDLKQNARSLLTPVSDPAFHALSHGSLSFALHGSFFNHFLIGQNSSTANQNL